MRAYTVATVAVTLGVPAKWLDNLLSRISIRGVVQSRQGVSRRLAPQAIVTLHIANQLTRSLGVPLAEAISLAQRAGQTDPPTPITLFPAATIAIDVVAITREVTDRLARAVEITPVPKRGRPALK